MIVPDLTDLAVPIADLVPLPDNPRRGDVTAIVRSLERFGQRKPLVVRRSDRVVLAGNHTLRAATELGWTEVAVVWTDDDETTGQAFALADNRLPDLGTFDDEALLAYLESVATGGDELLLAAGYDADDLDDLRAAFRDDDPIEPLSAIGTAVADALEEAAAEVAERFADVVVRSIVLTYPADVYDEVVGTLAAIRAARDLPTNSDAVLSLVRSAASPAG